jgi:hypothetical protein
MDHLLMLEGPKQPCLLRLRQTKNVLRLVERQFVCSDRTGSDNHGCQMIEDRLRLQGRSKAQQMVLVRKHSRAKGQVA